jgi:transposase
MKPKRSETKPKRYPSDLTRTQWERLRPLLPSAKPGGRPREVDLREILNGIFYIARGGCAWRMMPKDLPIWSTCYDYFWKWRNDGTWSKINDALRTQVRHRDQRKKSPSMGIIDSYRLSYNSFVAVKCCHIWRIAAQSDDGAHADA